MAFEAEDLVFHAGGVRQLIGIRAACARHAGGRRNGKPCSCAAGDAAGFHAEEVCDAPACCRVQLAHVHEGAGR